jgi:hypothetical protein
VLSHEIYLLFGLQFTFSFLLLCHVLYPSICSVASNGDRCRWFAEFLDNLGNEGVRFVSHPAAMSLALAAKQGCAMRAFALADNRVVRTALTPVGQLHRETTQGIGRRCR